MTAEELIAALDLTPHSEGGFYCRTWTVDGGATGTLATHIYFLFRAGDTNLWHRKDSNTLWHHYYGDPLQIATSPTRYGPRVNQILGKDIAAGARPQISVASNLWQRSDCLTGFCLAGVTVAPGFRFEDVILADDAFDPPFGVQSGGVGA